MNYQALEDRLRNLYALKKEHEDASNKDAIRSINKDISRLEKRMRKIPKHRKSS